MLEKNSAYYHPAKINKNKPLVIWIHHLGGVPEQIQKHIDFLSNNGFSSFAPPFFLHGKSHWKEILSEVHKKGQSPVTIWKKELEEHLSQWKQDKILYGFSLPSLVGFLITGNRTDIKGIICDGGPFLDFPWAFLRYVTHYQKITNPFKKAHIAFKMQKAFQIKKMMSQIKKNNFFPVKVPVLSLQGAKDRLVPPLAIKKTFEKINCVPKKTVSLKQSAHLEGLKIEPHLYKSEILSFLDSIT